ncbi:MAG: hypothetical protein P9M15_07775, partial [Candidatus Electryoneaceae bacterium]|nr:hypothetical protein [Candidatus Electryoneaceae bacterium]
TGVASMVSDFRAHRMQTATESKAVLTAFLSDLRTYVADLEMEFRKQQSAQATEDRIARSAFVNALIVQVESLLANFHQDRITMACDTKADLIRFFENVKQSVNDLRQKLAADNLGAAQAWAGIATATSTKPVSQPKPVIAPVVAAIVVPPTPPVTVKAVPEVVAVEAETPAEPGPDDLTRISGIGNSMRDRLNGCGIFSFEQLASTNSNDLLELLGTRFARLGVDKWIVQAKTLMSSK